MQTIQTNSIPTDIFTRYNIENTFHSYLEEFHIKSFKDIKDNDSSSPKEKILLAVVRDFIAFQLDFDLLISMLGMIWIIDPTKFDPLDQTPVEKLCFDILDLQWYIRHDPTNKIKSLDRLLDFYKKNKRKIEER